VVHFSKKSSVVFKAGPQRYYLRKSSSLRGV
jgi:hypothetical protein